MFIDDQSVTDMVAVFAFPQGLDALKEDRRIFVGARIQRVFLESLERWLVDYDGLRDYPDAAGIGKLKTVAAMCELLKEDIPLHTSPVKTTTGGRFGICQLLP